MISEINVLHLNIGAEYPVENSFADRKTNI